MVYLYILAGFVVLIYGAHFLVDGSSGLAKRFNVPNLIIGLTIVALGTSAPELVVNIVAAVNPGSNDIALSNVIGSNNINVFVILGLSAAIYPIASRKSSRKFDIPLSILAPIMVFLLSLDGELSRADGAILLLFFAWFMFVMIRNTLNHPRKMNDEDFKPMKIWVSIIMIFGGLGGLIAGAYLIVPSAVTIAENLGVSQAVIGLTIVALGTSLPELATSTVAAMKKNSDIALGNIIGSNIFNIFMILGLSATIKPLSVYKGMNTDLALCLISGLLVLIFVYSNKQHKIKRWEGGLLLFIYISYLIWLIAGLN
jgi:cation:H+ antiporter